MEPRLEIVGEKRWRAGAGTPGFEVYPKGPSSLHNLGKGCFRREKGGCCPRLHKGKFFKMEKARAGPSQN